MIESLSEAERWGLPGFLTDEQQTRLDEIFDRLRKEPQEMQDYFASEALLLRFLRARKFNVEKTLAMLKDDFQFRQQIQSSAELTLDASSPIVGFVDNGIARAGGYDIAGRPVVYLKLSAFFPSEVDDEEELVFFFAFYVDSLLKDADEKAIDGMFTVVVDLKGWGFKNFSLAISRVIINLLQDHYPERLGRCYVVHSPAFFRGAWALVKPILDERTRAKIHLLGSNLKPILQDITEEELEDAYGGKHERFPDRDRFASPFLARIEGIAEQESETDEKSFGEETVSIAGLRKDLHALRAQKSAKPKRKRDALTRLIRTLKGERRDASDESSTSSELRHISRSTVLMDSQIDTLLKFIDQQQRTIEELDLRMDAMRSDLESKLKAHDEKAHKIKEMYMARMEKAESIPLQYVMLLLLFLIVLQLFQMVSFN